MLHNSTSNSSVFGRRVVRRSNAEGHAPQELDLDGDQPWDEFRDRLALRLATTARGAAKSLAGIRLAIDGGRYDAATTRSLAHRTEGLGNDDLAYVCPRAAGRWLRTVGDEFLRERPMSGQMWLVTCLDRNWHGSDKSARLTLQAVIAQLHRRFRGLNYLLIIEFAYVANLRQGDGAMVMPHAHGILWGEIADRRLRALGKSFPGGIFGSSGLKKQRVYDLAGALAYVVKDPLRAYRVVIRESPTRRLEPAALSHRAARKLLTVLGDLTWPDLTIAGGEGRGILRRAFRKQRWEG